MQLGKNSFRIWQLIVCLLLACLLDTGISQETKWIKIGSLHNWFQESGSEPETARRGLITDQQDGLRWPAEFRNQDTQAAKALWIGSANYNDIVTGTEFIHKVVHVGPRVWDDANEMMPMEFRMIGRFDHPTVIVDDVLASDLVFDDVLDEIDPDLKADRLIINKVRSSMGIEMTRKIYAFSQQYHNNYHIFEYVFKNTGIVDLNDRANPQTLNAAYFFWQYRYAASREMGSYGDNFMPQSTTWGHNTMNQVIGDDPASGDPFRALFSWHGRHSDAGIDNVGAPHIDRDGHLAAPHHMGVVTLHADVSTTNKNDDPLQPTTTQYQSSDDPFQSANSQYNPAKMSEEYGVITAGHADVTHADAVGDCSDCFANEFGGTPGGYSQTHGFGPYDIPVGDSIRIVLAEGVSGIDWEKRFEVGGKWFRQEPPYDLPGGGTTNDRDEYKNAWVYTGEDSILQTFQRAADNFNSGFNIPQPPPPPDLFRVTSGGDRIRLEWSNSAESWPGFAGYQVYRAVQVPDTTYELVFECGQGTANPAIVNTYDDTSPVPRFDYYYFILSFDNGSNNTGGLNPSGPLKSSRFYTQTNEPARLKTPAGTKLDQVRVVPNPWNIRARNLQFGEGPGRNRLTFANVPPFCKVKVFTERGDLIQTFEHDDGSGDIIWEQMETTSRQIIVSGVYIAYFEVTQDVPDPANPGQFLFRVGDNIFRKFVVIR